METLFEGKTCKADYKADKQRIVFTFDGYADIDEHKGMYIKVGEFLKSNKTTNFIMDFRKMKGTFTGLNDWVIEFFKPAVELGLKKSAMVLNNDIFTAFASNDAISKVKLIQLQAFNDYNEAEQWCEK